MSITSNNLILYRFPANSSHFTDPNIMLKASKKTATTVIKDRKNGNILGVAMSGTSVDRVLGFVDSSLEKGRQFLVITPYAEMLTLATKDRGFGKIVRRADLLVPDGVGVAAAAKFLSLAAPKSLPLKLVVLPIQGLVVGGSIFFARNWLERDFQLARGRELFRDLLAHAAKNKLKVFLFGSDDPASVEKLIGQIHSKYKNLQISMHQAPMLDSDGEPLSVAQAKIERSAIASINRFKPDLLILGITPPKQEKWFAANRDKLTVGGAFCLGASMDIASGRFKQAPDVVSHLGLEWLWRLVTGTKSLKRVWQAFPVFPLLVFKQKLQE